MENLHIFSNEKDKKMEFETCVDKCKAHTENKTGELSKLDSLQTALNEIEMDVEMQAQQSGFCPYADEWKAYKEKRRKEVERFLEEVRQQKELKMEISTPMPQTQQTAR